MIAVCSWVLLAKLFDALRLNILITGDGVLNAVLWSFRADLKFRHEALMSERWSGPFLAHNDTLQCWSVY